MCVFLRVHDCQCILYYRNSELLTTQVFQRADLYW